MSSDAVLVTSRSFGSGRRDAGAPLRARGLELVAGDPAHGLAALAGPLSRAVAWVAGPAPVRAEHLEQAPRLRVVARYGTGTDAVDLAAAAERGVVVTNTPGANAESVADHAVALLLAALRHVVDGDVALRAGDRAPRRGRELGALTVGVVGFGRIGRALARRVHGGFGSWVLAHDPFLDDDAVRAAGAEPVALDELAERADVVSLHVPGGGPPLVDAAFLDRLRPGALLVNTARGDLLDEEAVARALHDGRLGGAALDVLAREPATDSPLLAAPRVVLTPHLAAQTAEAVDRMGTAAVADVLRVLDGLPPANPVVLKEAVPS